MRIYLMRSGTNIIKLYSRALVIAPLSLLGACASFQAAPEPVFDTRAVVASANNIDIRDALQNFESPHDSERQNLDPKGYRNMVIGTLIMAADQRYMQFRRRLSAESRGSSLALDVGILGLSNGASIAGESTANALAAAAAGLTGTRSAVSRDVYFDRTIPAMIGVMDAQRTELRTAIMTSLRREANEYPLAVALSDVAAYEAAASLDGAIEVLTREAAERSESAREAYAAEVQSYTGPPAAGVAVIRARMRNHLLQLSGANNTEALQQIADSLSIDVPQGASANDIRYLIQARMRTTLDLEGTQSLARTMGVSVGEQ